MECLKPSSFSVMMTFCLFLAPCLCDSQLGVKFSLVYCHQTQNGMRYYNTADHKMEPHTLTHCRGNYAGKQQPPHNYFI